jgi:hypothetical protein
VVDLAAAAGLELTKTERRALRWLAYIDKKGVAAKACDVSGDLGRLNHVQRAVVIDSFNKARVRAKAAQPQLVAAAQSAGCVEALPAVLRFVRRAAPLTINFSPDKDLTVDVWSSTPAKHSYTVAVDRERARLIDAFLADPHYRDQFETGITSGSGTAYEGGARDGWEKTIFEGGYHQRPMVLGERPQYGALNIDLSASGGAPRYGSCYFELADGVRWRTTLTYGDSAGVRADALGSVFHAEHILSRLRAPELQHVVKAARGEAPGTDVVSTYIEAQIHGPLDFATDIATMVVNKSFVGGEYEPKLRELQTRFGWRLKWHDGTKVWADGATPG